MLLPWVLLHAWGLLPIHPWAWELLRSWELQQWGFLRAWGCVAWALPHARGPLSEGFLHAGGLPTWELRLAGACLGYAAQEANIASTWKCISCVLNSSIMDLVQLYSKSYIVSSTVCKYSVISNASTKGTGDRTTGSAVYILFLVHTADRANPYTGYGLPAGRCFQHLTKRNQNLRSN